MEGFDVLINCPIERGYPKPEVSWIKDGNRLRNDSTHTIFSNRSLLLHGVNTEDDEGDYTCLAETPNVGRDNATTSLDVISMFPSILFSVTEGCMNSNNMHERIEKGLSTYVFVHLILTCTDRV